MRIFAPLTSEPVPLLQSIEVATSLQIPSFHLIGLPGPEVAEARERVRAAVDASGFEFPRRKVIVNLSPASIRKRGTGMDLAIALAVLASAPELELDAESIVAWGELGLDGAVKPAGQLTRVLFAAWREGASRVFLPASEIARARTALHLIEQAGPPGGSARPGLLGVTDLRGAWAALVDSTQSPLPEIFNASSAPHARFNAGERLLPLSPAVERILGAIALGKHHSIFLGPKGTGKSHALEWLVGLQDEPSFETRLNQQLLAELQPGTIDLGSTRRVSAQVRPSSLIGSASRASIRPGEFSLAHGGMLIADELPEWHRDSRECLREPLERRSVRVTRTEGVINLPANFQLAANGNLCPCGGWPPEFPQDSAQPRCRCTPAARKLYLLRLSGPVLDRIDLLVLARASPETPSLDEPGPRFEALRERVQRGRKIALTRWGAVPGHLDPPDLQALSKTNPAWRLALDRLALKSLRARHKVIRVALSLAAWDGCDYPNDAHFLEAGQYRPERLDQWVA